MHGNLWLPSNAGHCGGGTGACIVVDLAMHPTKCVLDGSFLVNHTQCVTACHHATVGGETNVETVI